VNRKKNCWGTEWKERKGNLKAISRGGEGGKFISVKRSSRFLEEIIKSVKGVGRRKGKTSAPDGATQSVSHQKGKGVLNVLVQEENLLTPETVCRGDPKCRGLPF